MGSALPAIIGCPRAILSRNQTRETFFISRAVTLLRAVPLPSIFLDRKSLLRLIHFRSTAPRPLYRSPDLSPHSLLVTEWVVQSIERGFWLHLSSTVAEERWSTLSWSKTVTLIGCLRREFVRVEFSREMINMVNNSEAMISNSTKMMFLRYFYTGRCID